MTTPLHDAVVVGSGPNGLAAAITLARAGRSVLVLERAPTVGGGTRSAELTLPGFVHDVCSAIHPMGIASPFFRGLPGGLVDRLWVQPDAPLAHPFDDGDAAILERSVTATAARLGPDGRAWERMFTPLVEDAERLLPAILRPIRLPRHPLAMARFGLQALRSCRGLVEARFEGRNARALLAGSAAHGCVALELAGTASIGLALTLTGHAVGWPCARGGSQAIADALAEHLRGLGGAIETGRPVRSLADLPPHRAVLFDLTPRQVLAIAGDRLPRRYRRALGRFRYGPGIFKLDWALAGPIPWRNPECARAATVHVGGSFEEIAAGEAQAWNGEVPERPFVLVTQQSLFDPTRAPAGRHTGWAYCHVPNGSTLDMTDRVEAQIERFAPGFRDLVLARSTRNTEEVERDNPNMVGGDIGGGANHLRQFLARPAARWNPYSIPGTPFYLCSSSTPPGGGVHGMSGFLAAGAALRGALR
ncbi:MAG TPA: NAD(P)/FAD-dependent oxidoreductase [Thermoanaerobaculia bacterium]|nr:NAD(P)/FAD-dependent oxidoreductase [Thermoanaerobaculia bacterium]